MAKNRKKPTLNMHDIDFTINVRRVVKKERCKTGLYAIINT